MRRVTIAACLLVSASALHVARAEPFVVMNDVRVAMSDGVVLAADVYVPTIDDRDGDGLYPCVVELTPYRKEARAAEGASFLPGRGIALIEVDARGTGGSQGEYDVVFSVREQADAAAWVEWAAIAAIGPNGSKLCEDTVGMYGGSYSGIIQYLVASLPAVAEGDLPAAPPHLAAIAPQRAYGDLYRDIVYHGGMVIASFGTIWSSGTTAFYAQPPTNVATPEGQAAWLDHLTKNDPMLVPYLSNPYDDATYTSDDTAPPYTQRLYQDSSILPRVENLTVPTLHLAGWFDAFTRGQLLTFQKALTLERSLGGRGPNHLIVGPWNHSGTHFISPDQGFREHLAAWYHHWLEDAANDAPLPALFDGPRVRYFQMSSGTLNAQTPADGTWQSADAWPPEDAAIQEVRLDVANLLGTAQASAQDCASGCRVRWLAAPAAGMAEILSRWDNAAGTPHPQLDQRLENEKGVTLQTPPLGEALSVAGPIGMTLRAGTLGLPGDASGPGSWPGVAQILPPYHDTDFVVKVSDVAPDGTARLVTQGYLRASHRAWDPVRSVFLDGALLAPFHLHTLGALDPPPADGTMREYELEIWPTAKTFAAGHRIRLDITSADTPNHLTIARPAINSIDLDPFGGGVLLRLPVLP